MLLHNHLPGSAPPTGNTAEPHAGWIMPLPLSAFPGMFSLDELGVGAVGRKGVSFFNPPRHTPPTEHIAPSFVVGHVKS
jgi:hypothetical protein